MDPRWIVTRAYGEPRTKRASVPSTGGPGAPSPWRAASASSCARGIEPGARPRVSRNDSAEFDKQLNRIAGFERTLTDDGAFILKFWMHLGKDAQKKYWKARK